MSKDQHIDEIFKASFDSFSPEVSSAMWNNISNSIGKGSSSVAGTSAAKFSIWKIIGGTFIGALVGVVAVLTYQSFTAPPSSLIDPENTTTSIEPSLTVKEKQETLSDAFTEKSPFDKNDPLIKVLEKEINQYDVAIVEDKTDNKEQVNYNQPGSIVNLFLTPKTRKLNNFEQEQTSTQIVNPVDTVTKVEIVQRKELAPVINASVSGGHSPLIVVFEQSETADLVRWDFGDGSTEIGAVVEHVFREPNTYTVSVQVESEGQKAQATKLITVNPRCIIQTIPNIFTPNGDGENDFFFVKGENIKSYFIQIFDLNGKVVFQADYIDAKWDGNDAAGNPLLVGQYLYFIKAIGNDQTDLSTTGSIVLRR